ncbi:hypothetical protein [Pedobacter psychrodurus]|uniref:hypothetical protein n=1 Tax=Pedobacter psychrodurus TaxID=2530456 RepID=UPI00292D8620|nr:hypothetical protein [Pedobacter psychrodurus]
MKELNKKFRVLRVNLRRHGQAIAQEVVMQFHPATLHPGSEICIFCNSSIDITREHVLPKWVVEHELHSTMVSGVNKQTHTYNKAVVPACAECNNSVLACVERYIIKAIMGLDELKLCSDADLFNIIRWLEIIDYKLQVLDCRRKYLKYHNLEYDPLWGKFPVSMMRHFTSMQPWKAYYWIRNAQQRITVKAKNKNLNSLVILKTVVPHFNFFSKPNEYIFISFPMYNIALFLFLDRRHNDYSKSASEALNIIKVVAES